MRIQALNHETKKREFFELESKSGDVGVVIILPDGRKYYLIREQVLKAIDLSDRQTREADRSDTLSLGM